MLNIAAKLVAELQAKPVLKAAKDATFRNLGHAAASIRKAAIASIKPGAGPSSPGTPPHTQTSKGKKRGVLPRAIAYAVEGETAVIGPRKSVAGISGAAHEHGGTFRGQSYPQRRFMGPALDAAAPRIGSQWAGTIGGA